MSDEEFYQSYGQEVIEDNEYDGKAFIDEMTELKNAYFTIWITIY